MERWEEKLGGGGCDREVCFSGTHGNVKGRERHKSFKSKGQISWQRNSGNLVRSRELFADI